jgi:hypothetical protein
MASPFLGGSSVEEQRYRRGRRLSQWATLNPLKDLPGEYFGRQKMKTIKELI